jgi:hypothetical protein
VAKTLRHNECHALRAGKEPKVPQNFISHRLTPVPSAGATGQAQTDTDKEIRQDLQKLQNLDRIYRICFGFSVAACNRKTKRKNHISHV